MFQQQNRAILTQPQALFLHRFPDTIIHYFITIVFYSELQTGVFAISESFIYDDFEYRVERFQHNHKSCFLILPKAII